MFTNPSSHPHHNLRQLNWMQAGTLLPPPPDRCLPHRNAGFGSELETRSKLSIYQCFSSRIRNLRNLNLYQCFLLPGHRVPRTQCLSMLRAATIESAQ